MSMTVTRKRLIPLALTCGLLMASGVEAQTYRWTDEHGVVHYSDKLPPGASRHERRVLDGQGMVRQRLERAPTEEELATARERRERETAAALLREEQERRDRILLQTFTTERDIEIARDDRLSLVDGTIRIIEDKLQDLGTRLQQAEQRLDQGAHAPEGVNDQIDSLRAQIARQRLYREERARERAAILAQFDSDLKRFRELRAPRGAQSTSPEHTSGTIDLGATVSHR